MEGVINSGVAIQPCYERLYCCVYGNFYPAEGYVHIIIKDVNGTFIFVNWTFNHSSIQQMPVLVHGCRFPISTPRGSFRREARTAHFRISVL